MTFSPSTTMPTMAPMSLTPAPDTRAHSVLPRVRAFLQENFLYLRPADFQLHDDDRLLERGIIDSMGVVELISFLEDSFGIRVSEDEISETNLGSVRAIGEFVAGKLPMAA